MLPVHSNRFRRAVAVAFCVLLTAAGSSAAALGRPPRGQHLPPDAVPANAPLELEVTLLEGEEIERVVVRFRKAGGDFSDVPMAYLEGETFAVTVSASRLQPPGVEYYIEGIRPDGKRIPLFRSADNPVRVFVSRRLTEREPPLPKRTPRGSKERTDAGVRAPVDAGTPTTRQR